MAKFPFPGEGTLLRGGVVPREVVFTHNWLTDVGSDVTAWGGRDTTSPFLMAELCLTESVLISGSICGDRLMPLWHYERFSYSQYNSYLW